MKPLVGLTSYRHQFALKQPGHNLLGAVLSDDYAQGVEAAGGVPLMIPYVEDAGTLNELADRLDALLLTGGDDVDPALFGSPPHIGLGEICAERDWLEVELIQAFLRLGKPILGICRGMQVLNAALGGTLYQDLVREWGGQMQHSQRAPRSHLSHRIRLQSDSQLQRLLGGASELRSNSFHHQAVKDLAPGFVPVAWDDEGLVEAMEHPEHPFVVAVQWHPENLWRMTPVYLGLFRGLVEAATRAAVTIG